MPGLLRTEVTRDEVIVIETVPTIIIVIATEGRLGLPRPKGSPSLLGTAAPWLPGPLGLRPPPSGAVPCPLLLRVNWSQECFSPGRLSR